VQSAEFVVRKAAQGDASGILDCLRSAFEPFRAEYTAEAFEDTILTPHSLAQRFAAMQMQIYVAEAAGGQIVGTIACSVKNAEDGHLRGMAVDPAWQGSGVASALLAQSRFVAETLRVRYGFSVLHRGVGGDVVCVVFNRENFHGVCSFARLCRSDIHHSGGALKQGNSAGNRTTAKGWRWWARLLEAE
jgi:N-acetylglutamate synthase-like GNAT family acetyltransferase